MRVDRFIAISTDNIAAGEAEQPARAQVKMIRPSSSQLQSRSHASVGDRTKRSRDIARLLLQNDNGRIK
jgi:hypothetical protein